MEKSSFPRETKAIVVKYRWLEVNAVSLHETIFERVGDFDDNSKITGEKSPTLKDRFRKPVEISEIFESKRFERQRGASLIFCDCQVAESQSDDERLWKIKRAEKVLETQSRDSLDSSTKYECAKDRGINNKKKARSRRYFENCRELYRKFAIFRLFSAKIALFSRNNIKIRESVEHNV